MRILGLDISSKYIGVVICSGTSVEDMKYDILEHIEFSKKNHITLWDKIDYVKLWFKKQNYQNIDCIVIEEPVKRFASHRSSINTIIKLVQINTLISYFVKEWFNIEPEYLSANMARKLCNIVVQRKNQKKQVADHMLNYDLKCVNWPLKKSGKIVDWSFDVIDAYVIAKAKFIHLQKKL